jgi:hypothetical protein
MAKYMIGGDYVLEKAVNRSIPKDPGNRHYQEYLRWLAEGNIPETEPTATPARVTCTAWQIRAALNQLGWRQSVETAVANSGDYDLIDAWEFSTAFSQDHPRVVQVAHLVNKTEADLQTLFDLAVTLQP